MIDIIKSGFRRYFSDPQAAILALLLLGGLAIIIFLGELLAPLLVALVLSYLLESIVGQAEKLQIPRLLAVTLVMLAFIFGALLLAFGLMPLLSSQIAQLIKELPAMATKGQELLLQLPKLYPDIFSEKQVQTLIGGVQNEISAIGQNILSFSIASAKNVITFMIFVILVPILVFFMLKDKVILLRWLQGILPDDLALSKQIWREVDLKIGNYIRGKFIEIGIVWVVTYITFTVMGLQYGLLLSALVGVSVIIPFIGAIAVTIPVVAIAVFQWGLTPQCFYVFIAYQIIQILDGNVLVPVLFSEVVNLHPVAIIAAVVFFGGIWGAWGVFFAIPLATLVQAVLKSWPRFEVKA